MLVGHKKQQEYLQKMLDLKKMPHALLFCGQSSIGKKAVALEFLKNIFGPTLFHHPDFVFLEAQEREIEIAQVRELIWKMSLKPFSAPFKAAIIDNAHLMNPEAQNCFLKTLEEPKGDTLLILISEYPERLLPTIRSRVQKIKFFPVERDEIITYLKDKKVEEKEVNLLAEIARGRVGVAEDLQVNPEKLVDFKKRLKEIALLADSDLGKRFLYAKELAQEEDMAQTLGIWLDFFRNLMLASLGLKKKWIALSKEMTLEKIKVILKNIQTTISLTSTSNVNKRLALENLLLEL
jgi:DNA polymerase III subunit delta'